MLFSVLSQFAISYTTICNYLITVPRPLQYDVIAAGFLEEAQLHSIYEAAAALQPALITRDK